MSDEKSDEKSKEKKIKTVKQAEWVKVKRSEIFCPDYNPRKIEKGAAEKLRKQIREDGLVDTIIVNKQTMNIVGGNQRTAQLDKIYGYVPGETDYEINVQMIDVDERSEIKINSRLNNPDAAGTFDSEKLLSVIEEFEISPMEDLNFDRSTFDFFMNEAGLSTEMEEIKGHIRDLRDTTNNKGSEDDKRRLQDIKKTSLEEREKENEEGNSEFMEQDDYILTIVFNTNQEKHDFMTKIGKPRKEKFIKASIIKDVLRPEFR